MNHLPSIYTHCIDTHILRPLPPTPPPTPVARTTEQQIQQSITNQFTHLQNHVFATFRKIERQIDGLESRINIIEHHLIHLMEL